MYFNFLPKAEFLLRKVFKGGNFNMRSWNTYSVSTFCEKKTRKYVIYCRFFAKVFFPIKVKKKIRSKIFSWKFNKYDLFILQAPPPRWIGQTCRLWGYQGRHQVHQLQVNHFVKNNAEYEATGPFFIQEISIYSVICRRVYRFEQIKNFVR